MKTPTKDFIEIFKTSNLAILLVMPLNNTIPSSKLVPKGTHQAYTHDYTNWDNFIFIY